MLVTCDACGKKYHLDPAKMKGDDAVATCTACGHKISVQKTKLQDENSLEVEPILEDTGGVEQTKEELTADAPSPVQESSAVPKTSGIGLRTKIFLLFFLIPIALLVASGILYLGQMNNLASIIRNESSQVVTGIAEQIINQKAQAVAREVGLYLKTHPSLTEQNFSSDKEFMGVAVQKVGKTGYTVINAAPTATDPWRIRAHPKQELIGADIMNAVKSRLSPEDFERFKKLHDTALKSPTGSTGYYRFLDDKEKFQAMVPIEGTNYWLISTTYIDEFTLPMVELQKRVDLLTAQTVRIVVIILAGTILLVGLIAFFYGLKLSSAIRSLTGVANRISVGELDIKIDTQGKDELGDLARAIARMQDSIRLSIERLRRRRGSQGSR